MKAGSDIGSLLPRYIFWDVKRENLDFSKDKRFIVPRIFERGKIQDVFGVISLYGKKKTGKILQENKYLSEDALYLAHALLGLPLEEFKSYAQFKHN